MGGKWIYTPIRKENKADLIRLPYYIWKSLETNKEQQQKTNTKQTTNHKINKQKH